MKGIAIFALLYLCFRGTEAAQTLFCPPTCMEYVRDCSSLAPDSCWACADSIFHMAAHYQGSADACVLLNQTSIVTYQLQNSPMMNLSGYYSTKSSVVTIGNYSFSGRYTANDFLWKNFSDLPPNHYGLTVRFSVGYLGQWSRRDWLRLSLSDGQRLVNFNYSYICDYKEELNFTDTTISEQQGYEDAVDQNMTLCIRNQEYNFTSKASDYLVLNFSALTTQVNSSLQFWGIKEIILAARLCHSACSTCSGAHYDDCLTCSPSYYLQGSACLKHCDESFYHLPQKRLCLGVCPKRYYEDRTDSDFYLCLSCQQGCLTCTSQTQCQTWQSQDDGGFWHAKVEVWVVLVVVVVVVVAAVVYKIIRRTVARVGELEQKLHAEVDKVATKQSSVKVRTEETKHGKQEINVSIVESKMELGHNGLPFEEGTGERGHNMWFNELVELQDEVKMPHQRRRRHQIDHSERSPRNAQL